MNDPSLHVYKGKKVLITGDTGFKGSWLAIWLLKLGADVTGFGLPPKTAEDNYLVAGLEPRYHHISADIREYPAVLEAVEENTPDFVFHLAAQPLVLESYRDPYLTFETNVAGTLNVLESLRKVPRVKAAVMVTSDKCYQNQEWLHGYREIDPLGGRDPYSASKGAAEIVISSYIHSFFSSPNTPSVASVRAGNVIGGGDWSENRIVPDCIRALRMGRPVVLRNPEAIRPWQHVLDPLYGYLRLGSALFHQGKSFSGPWNFGPLPQNTVTVETLVKELIRQWGSGQYTIESQVPSGRESSLLMLDISKAVHQLQWHPVLTLKDAVRFSVEEYRIQGMVSDDVLKQRSAHIDEYTTMQKGV